MPEGAVLVPVLPVAEGIKGFERDDFVRLRVDAHHFVHREDFHRAAPADVRHERIFILALVQQNGFGGLLEQVDDRARSPGETSWRHAQLERWRRSLARKGR